MTDAQLDLLVALPILGIATNVGLFLYLAGRVDKLTDAVSTLSDRVTRLEVTKHTLKPQDESVSPTHQQPL